VKSARETAAGRLCLIYPPYSVRCLPLPSGKEEAGCTVLGSHESKTHIVKLLCLLCLPTLPRGPPPWSLVVCRQDTRHDWPWSAAETAAVPAAGLLSAWTLFLARGPWAGRSVHIHCWLLKNRFKHLNFLIPLFSYHGIHHQTCRITLHRQARKNQEARPGAMEAADGRGQWTALTALTARADQWPCCPNHCPGSFLLGPTDNRLPVGKQTPD
jgi:hypothetical protein